MICTCEFLLMRPKTAFLSDFRTIRLLHKDFKVKVAAHTHTTSFMEPTIHTHTNAHFYPYAHTDIATYTYTNSGKKE